MLNKIAIGTANFGMPYGVLSDGNLLAESVILSILNKADEVGVKTFDTAYAYGSSVDVLGKYFSQKKIKNVKIINKFSVKDDFYSLIFKLEMFLNNTSIESFDTVLIHDPQNMHDADTRLLRSFLGKLISNKIAKNVGISVYNLNELKQFNAIFPASVVQCPINPFNQAFLTTETQDYFMENKIEVHARSLFLQGVLLAESLPISLSSLAPQFDIFKRLVKDSFLTPLNFLMAWANSQKQIKRWIFGVSSLNDFNEIADSAVTSSLFVPNVDVLKNIENPLIDPRNWSK
jgi:aryl-alcohol dehydrogenase-like predicted oxidoreductase